MQGCGWGSGYSQGGERSGCQRRLTLRARRKWRGGCTPRRPRQPGRCLALGAEGVGAARLGAYICSTALTCACCLFVVGMSMTPCASCASLLETLGAGHALSSCRGQWWGGTPRETCCHHLCHRLCHAPATLERSASMVVLMARGQRASGERHRSCAKG